MGVTRRFWRAVAIAFVLGGLGVLVERPVLVVGGVGLGAWLLAHRYGFVRSLAGSGRSPSGHEADLRVEQTISAPESVAGTDTELTLSAKYHGPHRVHVVSRPPVGADAPTKSVRAVSLDAENRRDATTYPFSLPVAGTATVGSPRVTIRDDVGFDEIAYSGGPGPTVTVHPPRPRGVHLGRGGERVAGTYGGHDAERRGDGVTPTEVRQYLPGDAASRIDWRATARLGTPHVREYDVESERQLAVVFDHGSGMIGGPEGERQVDHARAVALALVREARERSDPLGLYAFADAGLTEQLQPSATPNQHALVRERLQILSPPTDGERGRGRDRADRGATVEMSRGMARRLAGDQSTFARKLKPFVATERGILERAESPLGESVRTCLSRIRGTAWIAVFTDDADRERLVEVARLASGRNHHVLAFLTPRVLFEPGGFDDLDAAYRRYVEFEEFRRRLSTLPRVTAFEVGPRDRLDAILAAGTAARRR